MALAIDIGEAGDIHPTGTSRRSAAGSRSDALAITYSKDVEYSGPVFKAIEAKGNAARLSFDHVGAGLVARGGGKLEGFAVAGEDGKFSWADAAIEGDKPWSSPPPRSSLPRTVRYAWANNPACNLYNHDGLPAVPFRTDPPAK